MDIPHGHNLYGLCPFLRIYPKMASPRNYLVDAYNQLSRDINKLPGRLTLDTQQGVVSPKLPEISTAMANVDLLPVLDRYQKNWLESSVYAEWIKRADENENYWKGKHFQRPETDKTRALVDNVIFESLETSLPQYISKAPEPDVELRPQELDASGEPTNPIGTVYVDTLTQELGNLADDIRLKLKMKKVARHWALDLVGIAKVGWDIKRDIPMLKVIRPRKVILDPDATVDEDGYTGELVGELRTLPAYKILPYCTEEGAKETINGLVNEDLATKIQFIEWWSDTTLIWAIGGKQVLMKRRNPHWNWSQDDEDQFGTDFTPVGIAPEGYTETQMPVAGVAPVPSSPNRPTIPNTTNITKTTSGLGTNTPPSETEPPAVTETSRAEGENMDESLDETQDEDEGISEPSESKSSANHFPGPRKPYLFLVMFNLGDQPIDNTSLITQNLANQDLINKRNKQIDHNADNLNNGLVVSLERSGLTIQQARGVTSALRKGGVVGIPTGAASDAVYRPDMGTLPEGLYENLTDLRGRVYSIFGTRGSQATPLTQSTTVRGQIMNHTLDTDRIGGGISEILEQFADDFFNWAIQLKLVYEEKYVQLGATGLNVINPQTKQPENYGIPMVRCTVKQGSLLPKDKTTLANQAIELAGTGKMALIDLYKALEHPNAEELAVNAWLEANAPDLLYPDDPRVQSAVQRAAQAVAAEAQAKDKGAAEKQIPSMSISYKDLSPDGQAQLAAKAGITLHPEGIAAHDQLKEGIGSNVGSALDKGIAPTPQQ